MNFLVDYLGFILLRAITAFLILLPADFAWRLGRVIGTMGYFIDVVHRNIVYDNLKIAFGRKKSPQELKRITKRVYESFSQNIVELLRLPAINTEYLKKYISIDGEQYLKDVLKTGRGLIFLAVHFGSWEVSNVLGAMFGYKYKVIAKEQKRFEKLSKLLTSYRQITGAYVVHKGRGTRDIFESLRNNEVVGMVADQGGKSGVFIDFFGKQASMSAGAIRIALKLNATVLPVFLIRKGGPYHILKINPPLDLKPGDDSEEGIAAALKKVISGAEEVISKHPEQYMWFYKVWKYSQQRTITILSDGKAGHLRQSEAVANILKERLKEKNVSSTINSIEVKFKSDLAKMGMAFSSLVSKDYLCHGCMACLKYFLVGTSADAICKVKSDFVISCGSSLSSLNLVLARESKAKSICVLKPGLLGYKRFDLVILPRHDNPPQRKNIFATRGSPNLIYGTYLQEQKTQLLQRFPQLSSHKAKIGILLGGDSKKDIIEVKNLEGFMDSLKKKAEALDMEILITTSRRTPAELERLVKDKFSNFPLCKLMIIANEKNFPEAVGGILALSKILIVSEDSISMISEAASSGNNVLVLSFNENDRVDPSRHGRFLKELNQKGFVIIASVSEIPQRMEDLAKGKIITHRLDDQEVIAKAVDSII